LRGTKQSLHSLIKYPDAGGEKDVNNICLTTSILHIDCLLQRLLRSSQ
jgi:hypothetical protein